MLKRIFVFLLILSLLPVNAAYAQTEFDFSNEEKEYIYYLADGDSYTSDYFKFGTDSAAYSSWQSTDGENKVFLMEKSLLSDGYMVTLPLKANIDDKSNITLFYDFNVLSLSENSSIILPSCSSKSGKYLYISGSAVMFGNDKLCDIEFNKTYSIKCVKSSSELKIYIAKNGGEYEFIGSKDDGIASPASFNFGFNDEEASGKIYFDNFKICSNGDGEYIPRFFSVFYNRGDDEYSVKKLLGENAVFTSGDYFFANGERRLYKDYGIKAYYENGNLLVPVSFFAACLGMDYSYGKIDGTDISECIVSVDGEELTDTYYASNLLGLYTYKDERGFVVAGSTECELENSALPFEIKESADSVYRYMYFERHDAQKILNMAAKSRPRILTNDEALLKMAQYLKTDTNMQNWKRDVIRKADNILPEPCVEYKLIGIRLLGAAQTVLERCAYMASAYYLTGDGKYAQKCIDEMMNACNWDNWNTSKHYLDNSELCYAMAIGFDTFYDFLSDDQKEYIIEKTTEHSLSVSVSAYEGTFKEMGSEWRYANGNWGAVCAGGMTSALIAFAGENWGMPKITQSYLLANAMQSMEYPVMLFYPDGAWSEGTGYWEYTTQYFMGAFLGSLYFSTGSTWGFLKPQGVSEALNGFMYLQSESSGTFNFADSACFFTKSPIGFIFAKFTGDKGVMADWNNIFMNSYISGNPYAVLWYEPYIQETSLLPRDKWLISAGAGIMREKWGDMESSYVGIKGGQNNTNHDNLDLGSFIFDALGKRWAMELGKDNYNISGGYWGLSGYELYVKRPEGQNCLVINAEKGDTYGEYYQQKLDSFASLTAFESKDKGAYMVLDLTDAYSRDAQSYKRGFYFGDERKSLVIQDELELKEKNSTLYWSMHTEADIEIISDGKAALLTMENDTLTVSLDTNADITFSKEKASALPGTVVRDGENSRSHINKLLLSGRGSGKVYITVKLSPDYDYLKSLKAASYEPMSLWNIDDGALKENIRIYSAGKSYNADLYSGNILNVYMPRDFEKCEMLADGKRTAEFYNVKKGINVLTIDKNTFSKIGDKAISFRAQDGGEEYISTEVKLHFSSNYSDNVFEKIDFEERQFTSDASIISSLYKIDNVNTKDKSVFSVEDIRNESCLSFSTNEAITSTYPFIRKRFDDIACTRAVFEFDFMSYNGGNIINFETRSKTGLYAGFDGNKNSAPILNKYNKLGASSCKYTPGKFCHIEIILDLDGGSYIIRADGRMVSEGTIAVSDLVYVGLNFGSNNASGGTICIDNLEMKSFTVKEDVTDDYFVSGYVGYESDIKVFTVYYFEGEAVYLEETDYTSSKIVHKEKRRDITYDTVKIITLKDGIVPCREAFCYTIE